MNSNERFLNVKSFINSFLWRFTSTLCIHLHTCQAHFFMNYIHTPVEVLSYPDCAVLNDVYRIGLQMKWGLTFIDKKFFQIESTIVANTQIKQSQGFSFSQFLFACTCYMVHLSKGFNFFFKASVSKWTLRVKNLMVKLLLDACHQFCVFKSE